MGRKPHPKNLCVDCKKYALKDIADYFIVTDDLWKEFGVGRGLLCWTCFEDRIGRSFEKEDFNDCPANKQNPKIQELNKEKQNGNK